MTFAAISSSRRAFYVSSGTLDAVDFTGIGLLSAALKDAPCTAFVDSSISVPNDVAVRRFDPRLAVPAAQYSTSPDGSVRELVYPLSSYHASVDLSEQLPLMPGRFADLLHDAVNGLSTPAELPSQFLRACFREVGADRVIVRTRYTRNLSGSLRDRAGQIIENRLAIAGPGTHRFRQGGAVVLHSKTGEILSSSARWTEEGVLLALDNGEEIALGNTGEFVAVSLRGPLDAVAFAAMSDWVAGHFPWYMEEGLASLGEPLAVQIVRPLFSRWPGLKTFDPASFSGVLLDEFEDEGVGAYLRTAIGPDRWLFAVSRWIAARVDHSRERWAWSQAPARRLLQRLRHSNEQAPGSMFGDTLDLARTLDRLMRPDSEAASVDATNALYTLLRESTEGWREALSRWGLPSSFGAVDRTDLSEVDRRLVSSLTAGQTERVAEWRAMGWRLVECSLRAIMLVADTKLRASVPLLAMVGEKGVLNRVGEGRRQEISDRANRLRHLLVV